MHKIATALLALILTVPTLAEELRVPLHDGEELAIDLPDGWRGQVGRPRAELPPTITIVAAKPGLFQMLITPIWRAGANQGPTAEELRSLVRGAAEQARSQAVESELKLRELGAPGKPGYYFSATDRQPEPNGYQYLTQGALGFQELRVTFTILVNGDPAGPTAKALDLLRSLRRVSGKKAI